MYLHWYMYTTVYIYQWGYHIVQKNTRDVIIIYLFIGVPLCSIIINKIYTLYICYIYISDMMYDSIVHLFAIFLIYDYIIHLFAIYIYYIRYHVWLYSTSNLLSISIGDFYTCYIHHPCYIHRPLEDLIKWGDDPVIGSAPWPRFCVSTRSLCFSKRLEKAMGWNYRWLNGYLGVSPTLRNLWQSQMYIQL